MPQSSLLGSRNVSIVVAAAAVAFVASAALRRRRASSVTFVTGVSEQVHNQCEFVRNEFKLLPFLASPSPLSIVS